MTTNEDFEGEVIEDIDPYEGDPFYVAPVDTKGVQDDNGYHDDESFLPTEVAGLLSAVTKPANDWKETLQWYKSHRTEELIGFEIDGMCLKVCRTARDIPARYLTARESMMATPADHRVTRVRDLRRGMVAYFADPNDNNPADHIVTVIGRVSDFDPESLHDVLVVTNSVEANKLTVVRGDYFEQHWGDDFKFGATWLNGYNLDVPAPQAHFPDAHGEPHAEFPDAQGTNVEEFHKSGPNYNLRLLEKATRPQAKRVLDQIEAQVRRLPNTSSLHRVVEFKHRVKDDRRLDLRLLDEAVAAGRVGLVKTVRDEIRRLITALPNE